MLFCEKCNLLTTEKRCPSCGNKKLREVAPEDYCFFANLTASNFEMFASTLKENNLDVVGVPYYANGLISHANAGRAGGRKVFIRYRDFEKAKEIFNTIFKAEENENY